MSTTRMNQSWFDALGEHENCRNNASGTRSRSTTNGLRSNNGKSSRTRPRTTVSTEPSRERHSNRSASNSRTNPAAGMKIPTVSSSTHKRVKSEKEARARAIQRAQAYETLCKAEEAEQVSEQPPTPPSKDTPTGKSQWNPQNPTYAKRAPVKEAAARASQYIAYQPPPVPPKDKSPILKPKPGSRSSVQRKPVPLNIAGGARSSAQPKTVSSRPQSTICPSRGSKPYEVQPVHKGRISRPPSTGERVYRAYTPSPSPSPSLSISTVTSGVRRMVTPPSSPSPPSRTPTSPSYSATTPTSPIPSPRFSRSASPARGSWTADRPRQKRSSFVDRARSRMRENWHLNMQKAGVRPLSSFEVLDVRKGLVKDVATEWMESVTPTTPEMKAYFPAEEGGFEKEGGREIRGRSTDRGRSEYRGKVKEDFSGLESRVRRHQIRESQREEKEREIERARGLSFGANAASSARRDSLFLESSDTPTSDTFFASDWAQKQAVDKAKELVVEVPAVASLRKGTFGEKVAKDRSGPRITPPELTDSPAQISRTSADDRKRLPSQSLDRFRRPVLRRPKLHRRHAMV